MKQLRVDNGDIFDADGNERCPECGKLLIRVEQRGDVTAYVHRNDNINDCLR